MDRRQQKTQKAIFGAFRTLLEKKRYDHITVQEIIDEANVGRSTFYAHFETKDLLLNAMCSEMFYHIFEGDPCPWVGRDNELEAKLAHTLWHIRENSRDLRGILLSDSSELFMGYFKRHLRAVFVLHRAEFERPVPQDYLLNHLECSFAETVKWWLRGDMAATPEAVAGYFMQMAGAAKTALQ